MRELRERQRQYLTETEETIRAGDASRPDRDLDMEHIRSHGAETMCI